MLRVLTVAWREFRQTVMRKVFILAVFGMPILMIGVTVVAVGAIVTQEQPPLIGTLALVDPSGEVAEAARIEFDADRIREHQQRQAQEASEQAMEQMTRGPGPGSFDPMGGPMAAMPTRGEVRVAIEEAPDDAPDAIESLKRRVRDGDLLATAIMAPNVLETPATGTPSSERPRFQLYVGEELDSDHVSLIEQRLGEAIVRVRAARADLDPDEALAMIRRPRAETSRVLAAGGETSESEGLREFRRMIPMVFMMLIWIGVFTSGQHLMMSTIEEKSNRVMEVLLSAVSPLQLMTGKILGHGAVGLLIVGIYTSVGVVALILISMFTQFVDLLDLAYLAIFYFMAYFMIASLMAAVGSAVSDIREANTLMTPVMIILIIPLMLWLPIIEDPNGGIATAFSFIPPAIPFAMILRLAAEEPVPLWQIPAAIAWGYVCVLGMVWMAAKVFRVGVLMYGKPPSPLELIKWMRYA